MPHGGGGTVFTRNSMFAVVSIGAIHLVDFTDPGTVRRWNLAGFVCVSCTVVRSLGLYTRRVASSHFLSEEGCAVTCGRGSNRIGLLCCLDGASPRTVYARFGAG